MNTGKFVFLAIILSFAFNGRSQGSLTFVYDQQSANETTGGGTGADIQSFQPIGQSFTPTLSSVGFIRLAMSDEHTGNSLGATVIVYLRQDSMTGAIISTSDPVSMPDGFGGNQGYVNFFFSTPATVTPGTAYYLQPAVQPGSDSWAIVGYNYNYPGGTEFQLGQAFTGNDLWFREGIVTPEPSTWALLVISGSIVWLARRRKLVNYRS